MREDKQIEQLNLMWRDVTRSVYNATWNDAIEVAAIVLAGEKQHGYAEEIRKLKK